MSSIFETIITIDEFKEYQQGWSSQFEDAQIQDAINIATNDLNSYTNFLLERVYLFNANKENIDKNNSLYRNETEMKALKMSVLSQTYYKLMNGNDNSVGDASYSGAGVSISQSNPERNYIAPDVYQWLINARLINENKEAKCEEVNLNFNCSGIENLPYEILKKSYPDPIYVPSKFTNYEKDNLLMINDAGYVVQGKIDVQVDIAELELKVDTLNEDFNSLEKLVKEFKESVSSQLATLTTNVTTLTTDVQALKDTLPKIIFEKNVELTNAQDYDLSQNRVLSYLMRTDKINWGEDTDIQKYWNDPRYVIKLYLLNNKGLQLASNITLIKDNAISHTNEITVEYYQINSIEYYTITDNSNLTNVRNSNYGFMKDSYLYFTDEFNIADPTTKLIAIHNDFSNNEYWISFPTNNNNVCTRGDAPENYTFKLQIIQISK